MDYSKAIKKLRDQMIISQNELAVILGVSFSSVNRWENGKHEPTIKVKRKLNELFIKNNIKGDDESNGKK
jgi:DNA-binding XRE family transcriptional regulator